MATAIFNQQYIPAITSFYLCYKNTQKLQKMFGDMYQDEEKSLMFADFFERIHQVIDKNEGAKMKFVSCPKALFDGVDLENPSWEQLKKSF